MKNPTRVRRVTILLLIGLGAPLCFGQWWGFHGGSVRDLSNEAFSGARQLEAENFSTLLKDLGTTIGTKEDAASVLADMFGPPATSPMALSTPITELDPVQLAKDTTTQLKLAATLPPDSLIRKRLEAVVQMRQRDLVFRKQLEALAASGRPALSAIDRLQLANSMRALTNDQLNSILMRWVELAAQDAQQADAAKGTNTIREARAQWTRAMGDFGPTFDL